jgi:protein SCO1/2
MQRLHICRHFEPALWGLLVAALALPGIVWAHGADPHEHHHVAPTVARSVANYVVPGVALVRDDGKAVTLPDEMNDGRPVVLNFIYTTCTTVCPLASQVLSEVQAQLGAKRSQVHLMSISIDPEQDTPSRLHKYAERFGAGPGWQHYTGTVEASRAAQRAFGVYRGDKMDHTPATLVRAAPGAPWVRIDGFATPDQLLAELSLLSEPERTAMAPRNR